MKVSIHIYLIKYMYEKCATETIYNAFRPIYSKDVNNMHLPHFDEIIKSSGSMDFSDPLLNETY